jgi:glyoxylase-like metal-dependent hydrolase (beta-lactamase superfamily II)
MRVGADFRVGDVTVSPLIDGHMSLRSQVLYPHVSEDEWAATPGVRNPDGDIDTPFGGFVLRGADGRVVLVDVCAGPHFVTSPERTTVHSDALLPDSLAALGIAPSEVTDVVLTHLHADHIGWCSVDGEPMFPNAAYATHERDWAHFTQEHPDDRVLTALGPVRDQLTLWPAEQDLLPWLSVVPAPGHTPGTSVVVVRSGGHSLAMVGDMFHCPVELTHPDWHSGIDWDVELAAAQRALWTRRFVEDPYLVVGPHFPDQNPGVMTGSTWRPIDV